MRDYRPYVYIICEMIDGLPSFRHKFIYARDDDAAYAAGHSMLMQPVGNGINDYVVDLSTADYAGHCIALP